MEDKQNRGKNDRSVQRSNQPKSGTRNSAILSGFNVDKEDDSIPNVGIAGRKRAGGKENPGPATRISKKKLYEMERLLPDRDIRVLEALRKYHYLTSGQIRRLIFYDLDGNYSRTRKSNLVMKRLSDIGVTKALKRKMGNGYGGSSENIWRLTEAGHKLLHLHATGKLTRKTFTEPSSLFLRHTLAKAECAVQVTTICRKSHDLSLINIDTEPSCWRAFVRNGKAVYLKPDLFLVTNYDDYEDRWFLEIDLGTESPAQIAEKCKLYRDYYLSGLEQKESGMFPLAVWIVTDDARKEKLREWVKSEVTPMPKIFLIIRDDELEKMLRQYIEREDLC